MPSKSKMRTVAKNAATFNFRLNSCTKCRFAHQHGLIKNLDTLNFIISNSALKHLLAGRWTPILCTFMVIVEFFTSQPRKPLLGSFSWWAGRWKFRLSLVLRTYIIQNFLSLFFSRVHSQIWMLMVYLIWYKLTRICLNGHWWTEKSAKNRRSVQMDKLRQHGWVRLTKFLDGY